MRREGALGGVPWGADITALFRPSLPAWRVAACHLSAHPETSIKGVNEQIKLVMEHYSLIY